VTTVSFGEDETRVQKCGDRNVSHFPYYKPADLGSGTRKTRGGNVALGYKIQAWHRRVGNKRRSRRGLTPKHKKSSRGDNLELGD